MFSAAKVTSAFRIANCCGVKFTPFLIVSAGLCELDEARHAVCRPGIERVVSVFGVQRSTNKIDTIYPTRNFVFDVVAVVDDDLHMSAFVFAYANNTITVTLVVSVDTCAFVGVDDLFLRTMGWPGAFTIQSFGHYILSACSQQHGGHCAIHRRT